MMEKEGLFFQSIIQGDINKIKDLLGEDPCLLEALTDQGVSALMMAAYARQQEVVNLLLEKVSFLDVFEAAALGHIAELRRNLGMPGSKVDALSADGFSLLGLASFFGHEDAATLLVSRGADVNTRSENSMSVAPLHSAVAAGHLGLVMFLLKNGADVNMTQQMGITPLHSAAHNGDLKLVRILVEAGADPEKRDEKGKTALDYAMEQGFDEVRNYLSDMTRATS